MKRCLFKLSLFIILGVIVNIAVAWGFSFCIELHGDDYFEFGGERIGFVTWTVQVAIGPGTTGVYSDREYYINDDRQEYSDPVPSASEIAPHFGGIRQPSKEMSEDHDYETRVIEGRGWPLRALWCEYDVYGETTGPLDLIGYEGGIMTWLPPRQVRYDDAPHVLPYRIIFPGFYINSLFYMVIVCLLWYGPGTVRRFKRRRKGRCIKCGYDLCGTEHEVCPECGWNLEGTEANK